MQNVPDWMLGVLAQDSHAELLKQVRYSTTSPAETDGLRKESPCVMMSAGCADDDEEHC